MFVDFDTYYNKKNVVLEMGIMYIVHVTPLAMGLESNLQIELSSLCHKMDSRKCVSVMVKQRSHLQIPPGPQYQDQMETGFQLECIVMTQQKQNNNYV